MLKYTIKRVLQSILTVLLIATLVFLMVRMLPTDYYFTDEERMFLTDEQLEDILVEAGLRDPMPEQLMRFYKNILKGDFGTSRRVQRGADVVKVIGTKFKISMKNGAMALGISLLLGVGIGVLQTRNKNGILDHMGTGFTIFVNAVPTIVSFSLILVFGSKVLGLPSLYSTRNPIWSNVMPVACLALPSTAGYALWTRRYMVDELNKDYIKLARIKGLSTRKIMVRHVLKNAFVPLSQYLPASFLATIGGSLLVERFFSVPGMGPLLTDAVVRYDTDIVQTLALLYAALGVLGAFLGDILMTLLDPRISLLEKEDSR